MKYLSQIIALFLCSTLIWAAPQSSKKRSSQSSSGSQKILAATTSVANPPVSDNSSEKANPEDTRYVFIKTRPVSGKSSAKPKPTSIGLGLTLFQDMPEGKIIRVDPTQTFHTGDKVRFQLEPNVDGFLYIFHMENNREPKMLFPDVRLNEGANRLSAHVPVEIPSRKEADPNNRWFQMIGNPATESLYFVVTRKPLPNVPTGEELKKYCEIYGQGKPCLWHPNHSIWHTITRYVNRPEVERTEKNFGQEETEEEYVATSRDIGLSADAPSPTQVKMATSANARMLVMRAELKHR
ncbi:MAG: DUF4384 domain-containing protein [Blastocatellia bacterium]|nr:DUF4384 domain-containing protein [Blastocatellia bacterium]